MAEFDQNKPFLPADPVLDRTLVAAFLGSVPDVVYFKDTASRFIAVSASLIKKHGLGAVEGVIGKTDFDFFDEKFARIGFEDEQQILRTGEPIIDKVAEEVWADGRISWTLTSKLPLRNESGAVIGTFGIGKDVTKTKTLERELEKANTQLLDASRRAGMAEVAASVLHNAGNVLNSVNVSASVIATGLRRLKVDVLAKTCGLLQDHSDDLGAFISRDEKGRRIPEFLGLLSSHFREERSQLLQETISLQQNVDEINAIVARQQDYATGGCIVEALNPANLLDDAMRLGAAALARRDIRTARNYQETGFVLAKRGKVLQILVNLIRHAQETLGEHPGQGDKVLTLKVEAGDRGRVCLLVQDNGGGSRLEHLGQIFSPELSTRGGPGDLSLHESALAAAEMNGALRVRSAEDGNGAAFVLDLPAA